MTLVTLVLLVATLAIALGGLWSRWRIRGLAKYRFHRDKFFTMAKSLIQDEACPADLAIALRQIGASLNESKVLRGIAWAAAVGPFSHAPREPEGRAWEAFKNSPADIRQRFAAAAHEASVAVSYRSVLLGGMIRKATRRTNHKPAPADRAAMAQLVKAGQRHPPPEYTERFAEGLCAV